MSTANDMVRGTSIEFSPSADFIRNLKALGIPVAFIIAMGMQHIFGSLW